MSHIVHRFAKCATSPVSLSQPASEPIRGRRPAKATRLCCALPCLIVLGSLPASGDEAKAGVSFRRDIAPILLDNCRSCHGPKKAEGGYRVDTYAELLKAGDSGEVPIGASPEVTSELLRRLITDDESERMPAESEPLPQAQIEVIKRWIVEGGKFDGENASEPLELVIPPVQYVDPPEVYAQAIPITATAFSPDGKLIVTSGYHELAIWDAGEAKLVRRIKNVGQRIFAIAFSRDGKTLAVGCGEPGRSGEVRLIDFESGEIKGVIARVNDVVLDLAHRPGTNEIAIASADSTIRIFDVATQQAIRTIASHADWVTAVAWSDDGSRLASSSRDKSAKVYDGATGELLASYLGHGAAVRGVSLLADNKQVVSVGADNKLHRWEVEGAKKVAEVDLGGEGYKLIRHGTSLFVPCSNRLLIRIDLSNNTIAKQYSGHSDWVLSACTQPPAAGETNASDASAAAADSGYVASGSFNGEVVIWNTADAAIVRKWTAKP